MGAAVLLAATAGLAAVQPTAALHNGVGRLPPLGYNTWNDLGCDGMSEVAVRRAADAMVETGLRDMGYRYVNLDDCWHDRDGRDPVTQRLRPDPEKFPSGLAALGEYLHRRGLLFGIYTDRGSMTCGRRTGSLGFEELDAATFAEWGVDYVKEDNCFGSSGPRDRDVLFQQFGAFRDALNRTGHSIFFNVCGGGDQLPAANLSYYATDPRGGAGLANSWRISSDCVDWLTCKEAARVAGQLSSVAGPGGFNDPDMLLGSTGGAARRLSRAQSRTQFSVWAVLMAPLLIGAPMSGLDAFDLETYRNGEVLAVNQDPLAKQGLELRRYGSHVIWARELADGACVLVFENDDWIWSSDVVCDAQCWLGLPFANGTRLEVRDLWLHAPATRSLAVAGEPYGVPVPPRGASKMLKLTARGVQSGAAIVV